MKKTVIKIIVTITLWIASLNTFNFFEKYYKVLDVNKAAVKQFEDSSYSYMAVPTTLAFWDIASTVLIFVLIILTMLIFTKEIKKGIKSYKEFDPDNNN